MVQKTSSFFFSELQLITILLLIFNSCISCRTSFVSLKLRVWDFPFSIPFRFCYSLCFYSTECTDYLNWKCHHSSKVTYRFAPRPLICKLQQEVLKFSDICMRWSSSKTDLMKKLLNPENWILRKSVFLNSNFKVNIWYSFTYLFLLLTYLFL